MALLTLKDIGKIYVSDTNVAVGIRGVNLEFDKGEFVAITGKSGSGKSTLLNVISGMDTIRGGRASHRGAEHLALSAARMGGLQRKIHLLYFPGL